MLENPFVTRSQQILENNKMSIIKNKWHNLLTKTTRVALRLIMQNIN